MLTCLRVRAFAIIDALEVELGRGLNVVTGETGAGKSILVDALSLVLGARGKPELVRTGEEEAEVEALFDVDDPALRARIEEAGLPIDDELVVRRVIQANGRSRAYVNGRLVTATQLAAITQGLADISSQHEHHTLVDPATHLGHLDAYAGLVTERERAARAYAGVADAAAALAALESQARDRTDREDLLRFQVHEIDAAAPVAGEIAKLREERERLVHAERLAGAAGRAEDALYAADGSVCEQVARVVSELRAASRFDPKLEAFAEQIAAAATQLEDAAGDLGHYARDVSLDPGRLAEVEERLDALSRLEKKYGGDVESVLAHRDKARAELERLERTEEAIEEARTRYERALDEAATIARTLRARRTEAAERLGRAISDELASLGMGDARVVVELAPIEGRATAELSVDGARLSPTGIDRAELLIAPNRGEQARPLRKVASGGELSRSLLAIKRVLAGLSPAGLYVFDEVDAGVGGAVADVIGRKLRDVAMHSQVLCITHLAQIAVYGDVQLHVHKEVVEDRTRSGIRRLGEPERLEEVARMLGGASVTAKTREAAREMLEQAREAPTSAKKAGRRKSA